MSDVSAVSDVRDPDADVPAGPAAVDDVDVFDIIRRERERQNTTVQLIASENFTSRAVMAAQGSVLTNKYSEGYPGRRYYGGNYVVDEVEDLARDRVKALFGADHANVQPHSGANANMATYLALLEPGRHRPRHAPRPGRPPHPRLAGELQRPASTSSCPTGSARATSASTTTRSATWPRQHRPKAIVAGATAYPRIIDPEPLRSIADEVGALLIFDAAHIAGLIAGGVHPNPVPLADVVTFTTHKTLRGPRGGLHPHHVGARHRHRQGGVPRPAGRSPRCT